MFDQFLTWLNKVDAILINNYGIATYHVWQADWHFDWHQSWVVGCKPYEAAEDAIAELRDRGILEEVHQLALQELDD